MKEASEKLSEFNKARDWDKFHTPLNVALAISVEAGELLDCFSWDAELDKERACKELADVARYCLLMAEKLGVDLETEVIKRIKENEDIYPLEKSFGVTTKYREAEKN